MDDIELDNIDKGREEEGRTEQDREKRRPPSPRERRRPNLIMITYGLGLIQDQPLKEKRTKGLVRMIFRT